MKIKISINHIPSPTVGKKPLDEMSVDEMGYCHAVSVVSSDLNFESTKWWEEGIIKISAENVGWKNKHKMFLNSFFKFDVKSPFRIKILLYFLKLKLIPQR